LYMNFREYLFHALRCIKARERGPGYDVPALLNAYSDYKL
jgi:hypothetical protein